MNKRNISLLLISLVLISGLALSSGAATKKKVIPGGQNQLKGVDNGKVGVWLFNGVTKVRVNSVKFTDVDPGGNKADAGKQWVAVEVEIKNANSFTSSYGGPICKLQLVDQDGQLFEKTKHAKKNDWRRYEQAQRLLPAAGLKAVYTGQIESDYKPVRLIFMTDNNKPVFRINL